MSDKGSGITVGELIEGLKIHDPAALITFGGLHFSRIKHRGRNPHTGDELVQIEFVEQVYRDLSGELIAEDVF